MIRKRLVPKGAGRFFLSVCALAAAHAACLPGAAAYRSVKESLLPGETIAVPALAELLEGKAKPLVIDARSKRSYDKAHIRGAVLPHTEEYFRRQELFRTGASETHPEEGPDLARAMKRYDKTRPVVTYCGDGCQASAYLLVRLKQMGFKDVQALETGFESWDAAGYPVDREKR